MRLQLEELPGRYMMDAALANAFLTYLAPQMEQTANMMAAHEQALAQYVVTVASSEAAVMGPQFTAANLPSVVNAASALLAATPSLQMAVAGEIVADYSLLMSAPYNPGELQAIMDTVAVMQAEDAMFGSIGVP